MTAIEVPGYLIRREVGSGGMASVYLALQTSLEREVALKVMAPALAADPAFSKRFLQEARMLASLAHPNIVQVYDVGATPAQLNYFSMQYLPNGDFTQRVRGGISEKDLVRVLEGVANALGYAHQRGYVHRDVAPGNILFDVNDTPVLTDFGIARAISQTARITSAGISIGTSHYMSPEQARGGDVDARSDLYGLGVLTWFGLVGKPPYEGADGFAVSYAHVFEPIPRLPAHQAHWQTIIDTALAKDPTVRYQSADDFIAALGAIDVRAAPAAAVAEAPTRIMKRDAVASAVAARAQEASTRISSIPVLEEALSNGSTPVPALRGAKRWLPWSIAAVGVLLLGMVAYALLAGRDASAPATAGKAPVKPASTPIEQPAAASPGTNPSTESSMASATDAALSASPATAGGAEGAEGLLQAGQLDVSLLPTVLDPVVELVRLARIDLAGMRLTSPPRNNAFERLGIALRIDPKSKAAKDGVIDTAKAYLELADKAWKADNPAEFSTYLDKVAEVAGSIAEGADTVAAAKARRGREIDALLVAAESAVTAWDKAAARAAYEKILVLDSGNRKAREALVSVDRIGAPGFVFRDRAQQGNPPELVVVSGELAVARRETTRGEFARFWRNGGQRQFAGKEPSCRDRESVFRSSRKRSWQAADITQDDSHPVVCVSFQQASAYAAWLSTETGERYRLPTPAEWERVARQAPQGSCAAANLADASFKRAFDSRSGADCDDGQATTAPVASYPAAAGIFDIDGNVREWVAACGKNAALTSGCREHAIRGRGWLSVADKESIVQIDSYADDVALNSLGFRVVRELSK